MTREAARDNLSHRSNLGRDAVKNHSGSIVHTVVSLIVLIALAPSSAHASKTDTPVLRVGLNRLGSSTKQVTVSAPSGVTVTSAAAVEKAASVTGAVVVLAMDTGGIIIRAGEDEPVCAGESVVVAPSDPAGETTVEVKGQQARRYRGKIEVSAKAAGMQFVNVVRLEDYLLGVVPAEMLEGYPLEALKAQAVSARTYALRNRGKHASQGFDICDTTHCQCYAGSTSGKAKCTQAVLETAGMVLHYGSDLAHVMYSADAGGATQDYAEIYPDREIPYLRGARDPEDVAHTSWEKSYPVTDLESRLVRAGVKEAAGLRSVQIAKTGSSGRVMLLDITGATGTAAIPGGKLRSALGNDVIKSTLFTVEPPAEGVITFRGKGHGHGIGLCQVGAKGLAQEPHSFCFERILAHYFPGTEIMRIPVAVSTAAASAGGPPVAPQAACAKDAQPEPTTVSSAPPSPPASPPTPNQGDKLKIQVRVKAPDRL